MPCLTFELGQKIVSQFQRNRPHSARYDAACCRAIPGESDDRQRLLPLAQPELNVTAWCPKVGMETIVQNARKPVFVTVSLCAVCLCAWVVFIGSHNPPFYRRVLNVSLSGSGRWLGARTAQGKITIWEQARPSAPRQIVFPHGLLNDLRFSPDEHVLAIASEDLGTYTLAGSAPPKILRSDHKDYGSVRFSPDGQTLLVISGSSLIETIDAHSGMLRLKVCCSSIYGEAVFTPDGQRIASAGHWPSLWDTRSGQLIEHLTANREFSTFRPIAFDARRNAILMGSQDGCVYVWDLGNGQRMAVSPRPQRAYIDTLAVSTNGWVIFAGYGKACSSGIQIPDSVVLCLAHDPRAT